MIAPAGRVVILNSCTLSRRRHEFLISGSFGGLYIGINSFFWSVTSKNWVFGVHLERFFPCLWNFGFFWSFFSRGKNYWSIKTLRNDNCFRWFFSFFTKNKMFILKTVCNVTCFPHLAQQYRTRPRPPSGPGLGARHHLLNMTWSGYFILPRWLHCEILRRQRFPKQLLL